MNVRIPCSLIREAEGNEYLSGQIKLIFSLFELGRHIWWISEEDDFEDYVNSKDLISFREFIERRCVYVTEHNISDQVPNYLVVIEHVEQIDKNIQDGWTKYVSGLRAKLEHEIGIIECISPKLIESYINRPLQILVEDIESDRALFAKVIDLYLGAKQESLWFEFINGGGSNITKVAKSKKGKERIICVKDSDKITPEHPDDSADLKRICKKYGYEIHTLKKREMENYIPDECLITFLDKNGNNSSHIYFRFSDCHKDHFDLKNGLKKKHSQDPFWQEVIGQIEIAAGLSEDCYVIPGFGPNIWKAIDEITSIEQLAARDGSSDLYCLVRKIEQLA